jgi:CheY-like chemotaxis protein
MAKLNGPILLVEDDPDIKEFLSLLLQAEGYDVQAVSNGQEALDLLQGALPKLPSCILLDLMMPVMNGWEFRIRQKSDARLAGIPVVVISADNRVQAKAEAIDAAGFIKKPIEMNQLIETLQRCCS